MTLLKSRLQLPDQFPVNGANHDNIPAFYCWQSTDLCTYKVLHLRAIFDIFLYSSSLWFLSLLEELFTEALFHSD